MITEKEGLSLKSKYSKGMDSCSKLLQQKRHEH
jgi:hypothetical protein